MPDAEALDAMGDEEFDTWLTNRENILGELEGILLSKRRDAAIIEETIRRRNEEAMAAISRRTAARRVTVSA